ncbi:type II secretion system F family protein [Robertmurraya korlensis]|uniref:competence type IV pilus assembly protein ComGB n=1 Tax=Robertmurraya korlensis TaxID=519977 RepID=UPI00203B702E|nr:competence type IV pilus assembly protein ComGB [Robertmurraya korlensis]MCM3599602.1 type II secretion system F family protein [Robertmurraya korlensis]
MKSNKWLVTEQSNLLKHVGELLDRGYSLAEAMESTSLQMAEGKKIQLNNSIKLLKEGFAFSLVIQKLGFHQTLVSYVYFAEQHGGQAHAYIEASKYMLKQQKDKKELIKVLTYPLILVFTTILLFVFVDQFLLPKFVSLFQSMDLPSNLFTRVILLIGSTIPYVSTLLVITLLLFASYFLFVFKNYSAIRQKKILVSIPWCGSFFQLLITHYFSVQMSYLLGGGLSIYEAVTLFEGNKENKFDQELGAYLRKHLLKGTSLEEIIKKQRLFECDLSMVIQHGQKNGRLDQELYFFSGHCINRFQEKVNDIMKFIQPTVFLLVGLLVISMYLSILLPMFHLMDGI